MKLTIYMKSGNAITVRGIKHWEIKFSNNLVNRLFIERYSFPFMAPKAKLIMGSIDLSQIEAIVETKFFSLW